MAYTSITFNLETNKAQENILENMFSIGRIIKTSTQKKLVDVYRCATKTNEFKSLWHTNERGYDTINMGEFKNYLESYTSKYTNSAKGKQYSYFSKFGIINYVRKKYGEYYTQFGFNSVMYANLASEIYVAWEKKFSNMYKGKNTKIHLDDIECNRLTYGLSNNYMIGMDIDTDKSIISININGKQGKYKKTLDIKFKYNHKKPYEVYALNNKIKQVSIIRKFSHGKIKYYVQFTIDAIPYMKERKLGNGTVGIDINMDNIAIVHDNGVRIDKLCEQVEYYDKRIKEIEQKMDNSKRSTNPQNYNEDGTINKNTKTWVYSKRYLKLKKERQELYRKTAALKKQWIIDEANSILPLGNTFKVEDMNMADLAKRSTQETTINENTGLCNSKKRFGKSIGKYAPSELIGTLQRKIEYLNGTFIKIDCKNAASQYNPITNEYVKHDTSQRRITLSEGIEYPRDIIAAMNIKFCNDDGDKKNIKQYNREEELKFIKEKLNTFVIDEINKKLNNNEEITQSMGIAL